MVKTLQMNSNGSKPHTGRSLRELTQNRAPLLFNALSTTIQAAAETPARVDSSIAFSDEDEWKDIEHRLEPTVKRKRSKAKRRLCDEVATKKEDHENGSSENEDPGVELWPKFPDS